jgi:hypothetical protein
MEPTLEQIAAAGIPQTEATRPSQTTESLPTHSTEFRPWPVLVCFVTSGFLPATTAQRTAHVPTLSLFVLHVLAAGLTVLVVVFLECLTSSSSFGDRMAFLVVDFVDEVVMEPWELLSFMAAVVFIEAGLLSLALVFMPWGARDEPIRRSFRNAIRGVWLQTAHVPLAVFLAGFVIQGMWLAQTSWNQRQPAMPVMWPMPPTPPTLAPNDSGFAEAQAEFQRAMDEYNRQHREATRRYGEFLARRRWYVRFANEIAIFAGFAAGLWVLWALVRCIGAPRDVAPVQRPPMCDQCGYNLTGQDMESRCPECGLPVMDSIGPDVRPGCIWERRRDVGRLSAWWQCTMMALRRPQELGRALRRVRHSGDHRLFLILHLLVMGLCTWATVTLLLHEASFDDFGDPTERMLRFVLLGGMCALLVSGLAIGLVCLTAGLVGLVWSCRAKRNLFGGALQGACYSSGFLLFWGVVAGSLLILAFRLPEASALRILLGEIILIDPGFFLALLWLGVNGFLALFFGLRVWRATSAARYANR